MYSLCNLLGISDDFNIYKESIYYSNKARFPLDDIWRYLTITSDIFKTIFGDIL